MSLNPGSLVGPYKILTAIGSGGMGEVYLALDDRLNRKVALKILKAAGAEDQQRRGRFLNEAKAASSLNNPNIVTVYDIISQDHTDVIVMEYVEGESLRNILSRGKVPTSRALGIASEIASALAAAHNARIIHRDIKPENVILAKTNTIKVLDFGLAKLSERETDEKSQLTTTPPAVTQTGMILGTVAYMSPEQAEGVRVDHRTDIFSLGIVLFEMLCGTRPFQGNSTVDTLHAIMRSDPLKPSVELPPEVLRILDRTLAKNPDERYQHAGDLVLDLRNVKSSIETKSLPSFQQNVVQKSSQKFLYAIIAALIVLLGFSFWRLRQAKVSSAGEDAGAHENITLTPLTVDAGYEWGPTFSQDGETIAYVSDRTGNFEIFLKQISGGPDINLTNNPADDIQPSFSPDGKQIAFVSSRSSASAVHYPVVGTNMIGGDLWVMPAFGGTPRKIAETANFPSWSPDGSRILYSAGRQKKLCTVSAGGGAVSEIPIHFSGTLPYVLRSPVYSPSGRWVLFEGNNIIYILNPQTGDTRALIRGTDPAWIDTGRIVYSNADPGKNFSLWELPLSDEKGEISGNSRPLTISRGHDLFASPSRKGSRIAFAAVDFSSNLEIMPFDADGGRALGDPRPITSGNDIISFANFSPDGHVVAFASQRGASSYIWQTDFNSQVQLTSDPKYFDSYPRYSPDGKKISFTRRIASDPRSEAELWLMEADGANPQRLAGAALTNMGTWMPSGRSILYVSKDANLYSIDIASRAIRKIITEDRIMPVITVSPDEKWILYQSMKAGNVDVCAMPAGGGKSESIVASPENDYHPFISPSGDWLYTQLDHKNIYRVPGPGQNWFKKKPEKVTNFEESGLCLEDPQISADGKQLLYSRQKITGDIWILNLTQK